MANTMLLNKKMEESGLKKWYIAEKLDISRASLWKKTNNIHEFVGSEIKKLCDILSIDTFEELTEIFFN